MFIFFQFFFAFFFIPIFCGQKKKVVREEVKSKSQIAAPPVVDVPNGLKSKSGEQKPPEIQPVATKLAAILPDTDGEPGIAGGIVTPDGPKIMTTQEEIEKPKNAETPSEKKSKKVDKK